MTLPALLLAVATSTAGPDGASGLLPQRFASETTCALPADATWGDASYLYCSERTAAVLWERAAEGRRLALTRCEGDRADRDRALVACHARLVEAPPPAVEPTSPLLRILGASAGAGLGAGGAALACAEGRCSALESVGATALGGALGALAGGIVTEWLSP